MAGVPPPFQDLDRPAQRRLLIRALVRIGAMVLGLLLLYALLPVPSDRNGPVGIVELAVGLVAFAFALAWEVRAILAADYPGLRAVETLSLAVLLIVIVFAFTYLTLSHSDQSNFTERLDHFTAIYFTVTVLATVGFGDIVAKTDGSRLIVTLQMLLDLALVVGLARTIVLAAKVGVSRRGTPPPEAIDEL